MSREETRNSKEANRIKKREYSPDKDYLHEIVDYKLRDGRKIRINLYGILHTVAGADNPDFIPWKPEKLAPHIKEKDMVMHERYLEQFLPERRQLSTHDIDMADWDEWDRIESTLEKIDTDLEEPKNEPHKAINKNETRFEPLFRQMDELNARLEIMLKEKRHRLKKVLSAKVTEIDSFPLRAAPNSLNLRNAIMAAKITHLVKSLEGRKKLPREVHVLTGSMHTQAIAELLKDPAQTKHIIDFWEKDAPVSVNEFKKSFKKGNETKSYNPF